MITLYGRAAVPAQVYLLKRYSVQRLVLLLPLRIPADRQKTMVLIYAHALCINCMFRQAYKRTAIVLW